MGLRSKALPASMEIAAFADNPFLAWMTGAWMAGAWMAGAWMTGAWMTGARMVGAPVRGLGGIGTIECGEPNRAVGQTLDGDVGDTFLRALQSALGDEQRGAEDFLP